jgi:hypothetical protein
MTALIVTILGVVLAFIASAASATWLAGIASLVAVLGAYAQFRATQPFEFPFTESAWQGSGREFTLSIPKAEHKKTRPTATVFEGFGATFQVVGVSIHIDGDHSITVGAAQRFSGKVVIT